MKNTADWKVILEQYKASGLSKQKFCKEQGIVYHTFLYQFKKAEQGSSASFQRIVVSDLQTGGRIDFYFPDGRRISAPSATPKDTLKFLAAM